jgi:hypothetical protein
MPYLELETQQPLLLVVYQQGVRLDSAHPAGQQRVETLRAKLSMQGLAQAIDFRHEPRKVVDQTIPQRRLHGLPFRACNHARLHSSLRSE